MYIVHISKNFAPSSYEGAAILSVHSASVPGSTFHSYTNSQVLCELLAICSLYSFS